MFNQSTIIAAVNNLKDGYPVLKEAAPLVASCFTYLSRDRGGRRIRKASPRIIYPKRGYIPLNEVNEVLKEAFLRLNHPNFRQSYSNANQDSTAVPSEIASQQPYKLSEDQQVAIAAVLNLLPTIRT